MIPRLRLSRFSPFSGFYGRITSEKKITGPILEKKGMGAIFQRKGKEILKKGKILENLGKNNPKFENILKKGTWLHVIIAQITC